LERDVMRHQLSSAVQQPPPQQLWLE